MTSDTTATEKINESGPFPPPRWMTRVEKTDFRRLLDARNSIGKPVLATEIDLLTDYVSSRSRITLLRRMAKAAVKDCRDPYDEYGLHPFGHQPQQRHAMALLKQCEAAEAASRRLARDLKLLDQH
jgi:hypothetical protein